VYQDERGSFAEAFRTSESREVRGFRISQVNAANNLPGVLRGMHLHRHQFDYWYVASGFVQAAVHKGYAWETRILSPGHGVVIPPTTYHGFLSLTNSVILEGVSREYDLTDPDEDGYYPYSGPVQWALPEKDTILSMRDKGARPWSK
jgi:dTDP-4-dehydrorhamnose 3,5-epimerase-like enzyme